MRKIISLMTLIIVVITITSCLPQITEQSEIEKVENILYNTQEKESEEHKNEFYKYYLKSHIKKINENQYYGFQYYHWSNTQNYQNNFIINIEEKTIEKTSKLDIKPWEFTHYCPGNWEDDKYGTCKEITLDCEKEEYSINFNQEILEEEYVLPKEYFVCLREGKQIYVSEDFIYFEDNIQYSMGFDADLKWHVFKGEIILSENKNPAKQCSYITEKGNTVVVTGDDVRNCSYNKDLDVYFDIPQLVK